MLAEKLRDMPDRRPAAICPSRDARPDPDLPLGLGRTCIAEPAAVRAALIEITAAVSAAGAGPPLAGALELVLAEVLNNVVEHAYAGLTPGTIEVTLTIRQSGIDCRVRDGGRPMPGGAPPCAQPPALGETDDLPEGGFGWFLIGMLARDIAYVRARGVNDLRFRVEPARTAP